MMFLERLISTGMQDNPYWYSLDYNWFAKNDLWLPNCTCFSAGRVQECCGMNFKTEIPRGNAQTWYADSKWIGSAAPRIGAIAVWGGGRYGHVGVVERVNADGSVLISQSNYTRASKAAMIANYFVLGTYKPVVGQVTKGIGWTFLGYLINPHVTDKRVSRNPNRRQVEVLEERVRARKIPNGEIRKGLFIPMGVYNILDQNGDWVKVDDNVWFSLGSWAKVYEPDNELYRQLQDLITKRDELDRQIQELKKKLEA